MDWINLQQFIYFYLSSCLGVTVQYTESSIAWWYVLTTERDNEIAWEAISALGGAGRKADTAGKEREVCGGRGRGAGVLRLLSLEKLLGAFYILTTAFYLLRPFCCMLALGKTSREGALIFPLILLLFSRNQRQVLIY